MANEEKLVYPRDASYCKNIYNNNCHDTVEQGLDIMVKAVNVVQNTDHIVLPTVALETKFNSEWYADVFEKERKSDREVWQMKKN